MNCPGGLQGKSPGRHNIKRRAFLRELEAMSRLRSPHIVHVYGAMTSRRDRLVLVMELMSGGDLRAFLNSSRDPLALEKVRSIVADICAGMAFLHEKLTVHGDLKSENVLFDEHGRAKVNAKKGNDVEERGSATWKIHSVSPFVSRRPFQCL